MICFDSTRLAKEMTATLEALEVDADSIYHVVHSLIQTSLRGVDSHGINLFPHYVRAVKSGRINKKPTFNLEKNAASAGVLDADHAFGHHSGAYAMDQAVTFAKETGMGSVAVKNSTHFGAAAYFGLRAAEQNCLGFAFTNADALVKAHNAKESFFGTNPVCFTAPLKDEAPFCLDMATSMISWNKIKNFQRTNTDVPEGLAYDGEGKLVTNPHDARSLSPAGGYKGFGLGMMVDILCAVLAGGVTSKEMLPMYTSPIEAQRRVGHFFMAIDIEKFSPLDDFAERLQMMVDQIRQMEALDNELGMMVAGDPEKKCELLRKKEGIPVDSEKYDEFIETSAVFKECVINDAG